MPVARLRARGETPAQTAPQHSVRHRRRRGHRRHQDVPRHLRSQHATPSPGGSSPSSVLVRANDDTVAVFLEHQAGRHPPPLVGRRRGHRAPVAQAGAARAQAARRRRRAAARARRARRDGPRLLQAPRRRLAARSIARRSGSPSSSSCSAPPPPRAPIAEVMQTGHVGAEYVEYVLRHKRGLVPSRAPFASATTELDAISPARARPVHLRPAPPNAHDARSRARRLPTTGTERDPRS